MKFTGTKDYVATDDLKVAVNASIVLERPLLIKGEPGTGKTVLAEEVAKALNAPLLTWHIKSTTKAQQGLYEYDAVSRLRDSQLGDARVSDIKNYIKRGKLWDAFTAEQRPVLLIDEIDKADIEFPNDLLLELDRMEFHVYETGETIKAKQRPIMMITSNNEKELPDAFLRRCFFHYIKFPDADTMTRIVDVHFPGIKKRLVEEALRIFFEVREVPGLKKKPSTSELSGLAQTAAQRRHERRAVARARPAQADPTTARCAAQERAGRASVRAIGVPEPEGSVGSSALRCRPTFRCHSPRWRGIQYAAASRINHNRLWNTGSPGQTGR
ncbi:MoxR-like ATPase [Bradyrhizobium sp. GM22.5]